MIETSVACYLGACESPQKSENFQDVPFNAAIVAQLQQVDAVVFRRS